MINKDELKIGDTIWEIDFNGTDVMLREIEIGHLHQIAGKYYVSANRIGSLQGIIFKVDSHLLFHTKKEALDYMSALWYSLKEAITNETI